MHHAFICSHFNIMLRSRLIQYKRFVDNIFPQTNSNVHVYQFQCRNYQLIQCHWCILIWSSIIILDLVAFNSNLLTISIDHHSLFRHHFITIRNIKWHLLYAKVRSWPVAAAPPRCIDCTHCNQNTNTVISCLSHAFLTQRWSRISTGSWSSAHTDHSTRWES